MSARAKSRAAKLMRAAVLRDGRMVERDDVPEPVPGPGQVLGRRSRRAASAAADLHFAKHGDQMLKLTREMKGMPGGRCVCRSTWPPMSSWDTSSALTCSKPGPTPTRRHPEQWSSRFRCCYPRRVANRSCAATPRSVVLPSEWCCRRRCCSKFPTGLTLCTPR